MVGGLTQGHDVTVEVALVPEAAEGQTVREAILTGYRDLAEGACLPRWGILSKTWLCWLRRNGTSGGKRAALPFWLDLQTQYDVWQAEQRAGSIDVKFFVPLAAERCWGRAGTVPLLPHSQGERGFFD
jgi:hypothetical protein